MLIDFLTIFSIIDNHGRTISKNKVNHMKLPRYLATIIRERRTSQEEYHKTKNKVKMIEYKILQESVDLELRERRKHYTRYGVQTDAPSDPLMARLTDLVSQSARNRICYRTTHMVDYEQKFKGARLALKKLFAALEKRDSEECESEESSISSGSEDSSVDSDDECSDCSSKSDISADDYDKGSCSDSDDE